jgi:7-cyano-7-deazaguanine synthase
VLFSGGLDSTTLLYWVKEDAHLDWDEILAINITYGQKHTKELDCARRLRTMLGFRLVTLDLATVFSYDTNCTLLKGNGEIPTGTYEEQGAIPSTYVPFRNGLFLSVAASVALQHGATRIYYGAHADDARAAYPDCSEDFLDAMDCAISEGSGNQLALRAPFIRMKKAEIVKEGFRLQVPFKETWSCYEGKDIPCGICATCIDRAKAFAANGYVEDPEQGLIRISSYR